ncbi:MAG: TIGR00266 family protein [Ilumatobacteraceae bacterium]
METRIVGTTMPVLEVSLTAGETLVTEGGEVAWYTQGMALETSTRFGSGEGGGFMKSLKRAVGGGQIFMTEYTAPAAGGFIALAAHMPGVIKELTIDAQDEFMVQSGGFMAGTRDVEVSVGLQKKLGAGIFGGAGLVFQKLSGSGRAWVALMGEVVEYDLQPGQSLMVHPAHLALYLGTMELNFASVKGVKNKFFGDSLMMAEVHGPGHVWLQSMTMAKLADALQPYLPDRSNNNSSFDN